MSKSLLVTCTVSVTICSSASNTRFVSGIRCDGGAGDPLQIDRHLQHVRRRQIEGRVGLAVGDLRVEVARFRLRCGSFPGCAAMAEVAAVPQSSGSGSAPADAGSIPSSPPPSSRAGGLARWPRCGAVSGELPASRTRSRDSSPTLGGAPPPGGVGGAGAARLRRRPRGADRGRSRLSRTPRRGLARRRYRRLDRARLGRRWWRRRRRRLPSPQAAEHGAQLVAQSRPDSARRCGSRRGTWSGSHRGRRSGGLWRSSRRPRNRYRSPRGVPVVFGRARRPEIEHRLQHRARDVAICVRVDRCRSAQLRREVLPPPRQRRLAEFIRKLERLAVKRFRPRGRAKERRWCEAHECLEELAVRDAILFGVGWLVVIHCMSCVDCDGRSMPSSARSKLSRSGRSARAVPRRARHSRRTRDPGSCYTRRGVGVHLL
jgi:hypothetical protein